MKRIQPGPGQESVWDYPRPPAVRDCRASIEVFLGGELICRTATSWQVVETSHPPVYYLPRTAFAAGALTDAPGTTFCEYKGAARYLDVHGGGQVRERAAWFYPDPAGAFAVLREHVAVYAGEMDRCLVDGVPVRPQPGHFYGGWITPDVVGPFKGAPGTAGW